MNEFDARAVAYRPGLKARLTPSGVRVIEIDYWADPEKTEAWANEQRRTMSSRDWRREMERDWGSPAGEAFFPQFNENGGREKFVHQATRLMGKSPVVFRCLDFGQRRPACIWLQYSPASDRVWVLREFMPHDLLIIPFRDAVRYLSGEIPYASLLPEARRWVDAYLGMPQAEHCASGPWFPLGTRFVNVAGKEAVTPSANAAVAKPEDLIPAEIFAAADMPIIRGNDRVLGRNYILGRLLHLRPDGWPGLLIDPQCEELLQGFEGAFSYPQASKANPYPTKPRKDGHFENLLDALGYGVSAIVPEDTPQPTPAPRLLGHRGREPVYWQPEEGLAWSEVRPRLR